MGGRDFTFNRVEDGIPKSGEIHWIEVDGIKLNDPTITNIS